jgi:hypothetical protein
MFMAEFADRNRKEALEVLQLIFLQDVMPGKDPLPHLIACLLEDGAGGLSPPPEVPLTTEDWLSWNQLAMEQPRELTWTLTDILEEERLKVPRNVPALVIWAATLVQLTLDRMEPG